MSNILDRLQDPMNFTNAEVSIVEYILENPNNVTKMTLKEFSKKTFSSEATIIRVCRKIGLSGYSDLKIRLASEMNSLLIKDGEIKVDAPIKKGDTEKDIAKTLLNLSSHALADTFQNMDLKKIHNAAHMLYHSESVSLYARGESLLVAMDLHMKLMRTGIVSSLEMMNGLQESRSRSKHMKETAIVISLYADSRQVKYIMKELKHAETPVILITGNHASPVLELADLTIFINNDESRFKMGAFASRISMQFITDSIYLTLFSMNYDKNMQALIDYANRRGQDRY